MGFFGVGERGRGTSVSPLWLFLLLHPSEMKNRVMQRMIALQQAFAAADVATLQPLAAKAEKKKLQMRIITLGYKGFIMS